MPTAKKKPAAKAANRQQPVFRVVGNDEAAAPRSKLNLGGLRKSTERTGKAKHPIVQVGAEAMELLEQFVEFAPKYKELDQLVGSRGSVKGQLAPHIKETYFRRFAGGTPDSTMLCDVHGNLVKLVTKNRYSTKCTDLGALDEAGDHFRTAVLIKIDMEKIAEEKQQRLVDAIIAAAQQLEIPDGIEYTECVQPKAGFHEARTTLLTPEENIALDAHIPITAYPQL